MHARSARPAARLRAALPALGAVVLLASCSPQGPVPRTLRIVATDHGHEMPERVPAGVTLVKLLNRGTTPHEGLMVHFLTMDATGAAYADSVRAGIDFPAFAEDVGGPGIAEPGDSSAVWMDLMPGHYAVLCFYKGDLEHDTIREFEVVPAQAPASPPPADLHVRLTDFQFDLSGKWTAGRHVVLVENEGKEPHEFDPYRLAPGKSPEDYFTWMETGRNGPAPATPLGGSGSFVPGRRIWLPLVLRRGRYFMFCEVPAKADSRPHYRHGMFRTFEVK